jgi:predicted phage terminase large subunit-like protein
MLNLSQKELEFLLNNLSQLTPTEQQQVAAVLEELERRKYAKQCQSDLLTFCKHIDSSYLVAAHHRRLADLLMQIALGTKDRIAVSVPPRHGKSHLASTLFPAWFLGKFPDKKVLMVSNTAELAVDFGRKVRNIIADPRYQAVFPGISLSADSKSAGRWSTNKGGEFFATGVGGALAGRGADLLLVDDPHDEQDLLAGNFDALEKAYQWFTFGARTRLMSGGRVAVIHCMTGDTPVLMGDGSERPLRDVRPGDVVASYENGVVTQAKVLNWASQGLDHILTIKTTSGKILRANERHPLLAQTEGKLEWTKVRDLRVGSRLIGVSQPPATPSIFAPLNTYVLTLDPIVEITLDGYEEVFDIQVEGTENFIANGIISHNTRWHQDDLIGRLTKDAAKNEKADQYEVFEFPAVLTVKKTDENGEETVVEKALWPEKFDLAALERTKASMPTFQWNAQYMQNPTSEEAAILKREWWKLWEKDNPPSCEYVIMTLDAAAEKHNRADYTALTTWGVFSDDELTDGAPHLILLNSIKTRVEFPELKDLAMREWKEWEPDAFIVEKKSAGTQLYQELRRLGIPVQEFTPGRNTGDKIARLNAVADIVRSGMVWYPAGRRWAEELVEDCVAFPYGTHDDLVDCTSMALARFRNGGFIRLPTDYKDEPLYYNRRPAYY